MCMSMKMIVYVNVNQHVLGSITGEMSEGSRYYPFISVLIEFSLFFRIFFGYVLLLFSALIFFFYLFLLLWICLLYCFVERLKRELEGNRLETICFRNFFFNSMDQVRVISKPDSWILGSGKNSTLLSLSMMNQVIQ